MLQMLFVTFEAECTLCFRANQECAILTAKYLYFVQKIEFLQQWSKIFFYCRKSWCRPASNSTKNKEKQTPDTSYKFKLRSFFIKVIVTKKNLKTAKGMSAVTCCFVAMFSSVETGCNVFFRFSALNSIFSRILFLFCVVPKE